MVTCCIDSKLHALPSRYLGRPFANDGQLCQIKLIACDTLSAAAAPSSSAASSVFIIVRTGIGVVIVISDGLGGDSLGAHLLSLGVGVLLARLGRCLFGLLLRCASGRCCLAITLALINLTPNHETQVSKTIRQHNNNHNNNKYTILKYLIFGALFCIQVGISASDHFDLPPGARALNRRHHGFFFRLIVIIVVVDTQAATSQQTSTTSLEALGTSFGFIFLIFARYARLLALALATAGVVSVDFGLSVFVVLIVILCLTIFRRWRVVVDNANSFLGA
jgi:hypothetical protein